MSSKLQRLRDRIAELEKDNRELKELLRKSENRLILDEPKENKCFPDRPESAIDA